MKIPETEIARLKTDVDLAAHIRGLGFTLEKRGASFALNCPFHGPERTASLFITRKNMFHCFGCGTAGTIFDFTMRHHGVSFPEAGRMLLAQYPALKLAAGDGRSPPQPPLNSGNGKHKGEIIRMEGAAGAAGSDNARNPDQNANPLLDPHVQKAARLAMEYYRKTLEQSPDARAYLMSRGIAHADLLTSFPMGFSDGTLLSKIAPNTDEGRALRKALLACGILREKNGRVYEHMKGRIVFGIEEEEGVLVQMYGRKLPVHGSTSPDHLYLPFTRNCVFNPRAFIAETLVVCESVIDALSFWISGLRNVTCTFSATDIPPAFREAVERGNVRRIVCAFDPDDAGTRGAEKLREKFT